MRVHDLMTTDVVSVAPETPLKEVARILAERGISGVPVRGADGAVLGVVSEGDVLLKEQGRSSEPSGLFALFFEERRERLAAKAAARTAGEAMTSPAVTIAPERPASAAARTMVERGVNRLPVVRDGELVGIVSRADLVRAFVRDDEEIAAEIRDEVIRRALWASPDDVEVGVDEGDVTLAGEVETSVDAEVLEQLVRRVPGVVSVTSRVRWRTPEPAR